MLLSNTRLFFFNRFWIPMAVTRSMSEVSLPAITLSRPRPTANSPTASATSTGAPTPRRFPSTSTVSSLLANLKCLLTPSKLKVRHTTFFKPPPAFHMAIQLLTNLPLQSRNCPISSPKSKTSSNTLLSESEPTATPPRAPTPASSGGICLSSVSSSASLSSKSGGCAASSKSSVSYKRRRSFFFYIALSNSIYSKKLS